MSVWIFAVCAVIYLLLQTIKIMLASICVRRIRKQSAQRESAAASIDPHATSIARASITIAQAILSGDSQLHATLANNTASLPVGVRFYWMIDVADDVALDTALQISPMARVVTVGGEMSDERNGVLSRQRAIRSEADDRITIFLCPEAPSDCNPKTFKLAIALENSSSDYFVVLDDDTTIQDDSLSSAICSLAVNDLYTGLPYYQRGSNLWSDCVAHFVNNNSILTYLPPLLFFPTISINGMFYVCKTARLREIGGFRAIQHDLCDDYALHRLMQKYGRSIEQGVTCQEIATTIVNAKHYLRLMHRWSLFAIMLHRDQRPAVQAYLAGFLALPPVLLNVSCIAAFLSAVAGNWQSVLILIVFLTVRGRVIALAQYQVFGSALSTNPFVSLLIELLQPIHLVNALLLRTIDRLFATYTIQAGFGCRSFAAHRTGLPHEESCSMKSSYQSWIT